MRDKLLRSLDLNLNWFRNSGVMLPSDGSWGVAERILLTENNSALDKIRVDFPTWTDHDGKYSIIEHRRADCCMETAFLFMLAGDEDTARNIIDFLFCRNFLFRDIVVFFILLHILKPLICIQYVNLLIYIQETLNQAVLH